MNDKISNMLNMHELWINSNKKEGKRACFYRVLVREALYISNMMSFFNEIVNQNEINIPLKDTIIMDRNLEESDFSKAIIDNVYFINCNLSKADFTKAELTNIYFLRCNLNDVMFTDTKFNQISLIESEVNESQLTRHQKDNMLMTCFSNLVDKKDNFEDIIIKTY